MYFSPSLIAALASGALALPNYGSPAETTSTTCTEEESKPTFSAVSTYSPPAPVYSTPVDPPSYPPPAPEYDDAEEDDCTEEWEEEGEGEGEGEYPSATYPAPSHYTSAAEGYSSAAGYSSATAHPGYSSSAGGYSSASVYPGHSSATGGYGGHSSAEYGGSSSSTAGYYSSKPIYSSHPVKPTYPTPSPLYPSVKPTYPSSSPLYPSGNNSTLPSGIPTPTLGPTPPIFTSTSVPSTTSTIRDPLTLTGSLTFSVPSNFTSTFTISDPVTFTSTSTSSAPTTTPTDDPGCGSSENPCDGGEVPCEGCDGSPIDGGIIPNPEGPDDNGGDENGDGVLTDAEICGASNIPSCCTPPTTADDNLFVPGASCSVTDPISGCPAGATYCCPLIDDTQNIDTTQQCALINLFLQ
ncbi:uncharacterized protein SEPMUDRAFT_151969 [Sphaerulina musiva SO2202]|uniref:Uncharacterized protein n=1 Tax=Sphaerulina musiva (strain SO2202) TaxID=692275 RepID=M3BQ30_SPHMS|nr:uncharacterized protein SEPMUDRAFT_151969 [Sphaerulina musiva SO2202]EMF08263.1 hypothetical protein SEPMUDRAFT_151969 [Sphaerulina musiva SO2202]